MHAILITGYSQIDNIFDIISCFDENFKFYIHLDKSVKLKEVDKKKMEQNNLIHFIDQRYVTYWGSYNHLLSILLLCEKALENPENIFFHLISEADFPLRKKNDFISFFQPGKQYLHSFLLPTSRWAEGGYERLEYFYPNDLFNLKNGKNLKYMYKFLSFQRKIGFRRNMRKIRFSLYGGSTWWSLDRNCINYILSFTKSNPYFLNRLRYTFIPEEIYIPTVIMNSPYSKEVTDTNLRYIDWRFRNNNSPAHLDISDYPLLIKSGDFFARKLVSPVSDLLKNQLLDYHSGKFASIEMI